MIQLLRLNYLGYGIETIKKKEDQFSNWGLLMF